MGRALIPELLSQGHQITAVVRPGSQKKVVPGCRTIVGNVLESETYASEVAGHDTFVHLVGVPHPSPSKADEFRRVDLKSAQQAIAAASRSLVRHFVYVSVAQPAPVMRAYLEVRAACEQTLRESGLNATLLRPWYVLGPGHRWPLLLAPFYQVAELIPSTRESAIRLGLVKLPQMVRALAAAVNSPPQGVRVWSVPDIRRLAAPA